MSEPLSPDELKEQLSALLDRARPTTAEDAMARAASRPATPFIGQKHLSPVVDRRRSIVATLAIAVALVAAAIIVPLSTSPRSTVGLSPTPASWHLAGYLDEPAWSAVNPAPGSDAPVGLSCPGASTCYLATDTTQVGPSLNLSTDGGVTWNGLSLPPGVQSINSLSCVSVATCFVGATTVTGSGPATANLVLLVTNDMGANWFVALFPPGISKLGRLSCVDTEHCVAAGERAGDGATPVALATKDGGMSWSVTALPSMLDLGHLGQLDCTSDTRCLVTGSVPGGPTGTRAVVALTVDDGATWRRAVLPADLYSSGGISCVNESECLALASVPSRVGPGFPVQQSLGIDRPSADISSDDGGRSWRKANSSGLGQVVLYSVACVTPMLCYVGGVGNLRAGAGYQGYGILLVTQNGSSTWSEVSLPAAVGTLWGIGYLSCAPGGTCYALAAQVFPSRTTSTRLVVLSDRVPAHA